jgi:hypothetical protein
MNTEITPPKSVLNLSVIEGGFKQKTDSDWAEIAAEAEKYAVYRKDGSEDFQATTRRHELAQLKTKHWSTQLATRLYFFTIDCGGRKWYRVGKVSGGLLDFMTRKWRVPEYEFHYDVFHTKNEFVLERLRTSVLWKSIERNNYKFGDSAGFIALHWRERKVSRFDLKHNYGFDLAGLPELVKEAKALHEDRT